MTKNINDIIDFSTNHVEKEFGTVPHKLIKAGIAGHAVKEINTVTLNHYTDPTKQFLQAFGNQAWEQKP